MKQEDKELLLKDLCARLPYKVKINIPDMWNSTKTNIEVLEEIFCGDDGNYRCNNSGMLIDYCKPFLFPLSSITEEQREELLDEHFKDTQILLDIAREVIINKNMDKRALGISRYAQDWCHKNHFDYRGLIPMDLALDATNLNIY